MATKERPINANNNITERTKYQPNTPATPSSRPPPPRVSNQPVGSSSPHPPQHAPKPAGSFSSRPPPHISLSQPQQAPKPAGPSFPSSLPPSQPQQAPKPSSRPPNVSPPQPKPANSYPTPYIASSQPQQTPKPANSYSTRLPPVSTRPQQSSKPANAFPSRGPPYVSPSQAQQAPSEPAGPYPSPRARQAPNLASPSFPNLPPSAAQNATSKPASPRFSHLPRSQVTSSISTSSSSTTQQAKPASPRFSRPPWVSNLPSQQQTYSKVASPNPSPRSFHPSPVQPGGIATTSPLSQPPSHPPPIPAKQINRPYSSSSPPTFIPPIQLSSTQNSSAPPATTRPPPITRTSSKTWRVSTTTITSTTSISSSTSPSPNSSPRSSVRFSSTSYSSTTTGSPASTVPPSPLRTSSTLSSSPLRTSSSGIPLNSSFTLPPSSLRTSSSTVSPPSPRLRSSTDLRSSNDLRLSTLRSSSNLNSSTGIPSPLRSSTTISTAPSSSPTISPRFPQKQSSQTNVSTPHTPPTAARSAKPPAGTRVRALSKTFSSTEVPPPLPKKLSSKTLQALKAQKQTNYTTNSRNPFSSSSNLKLNEVKHPSDPDVPPPLPPKPKLKKRTSSITFSASEDPSFLPSSPPLQSSDMPNLRSSVGPVNPLKTSTGPANPYIPCPFVPPSSPRRSRVLTSSSSRALSSSASKIPRPVDSPTTERRSRLMKLSAHTKKFKKIKITVIGDTGIGKSNLISRLVSQTFTEEHKPTIFDSHTFLTKFGPWGVQLLIWEPSCTDKYTVKRPVCYPETGIFMICFDLSQPHSFHAAKQKWLEELQTHGYTNTPKIFVGLKQDVSLGFQEEIAYNQSYDNVTEEQYTICECSAKKDEGIDDVFEETIRKYIYYDQAKGDLGWRDVRVFASATTQKITNIFSMLN